MKIQRIDWDGSDAGSVAERLRELSRSPAGLAREVARIVADVRERGDNAVRELTARYDATTEMPDDLRVLGDQIEAALDSIDPGLREALELAADNIRRVAEAELAGDETDVRLPQGHRVSVVASAVASAGLYAPGGRAAYPSSVLMAAVPAKAAGVARVALASPAGEMGRISTPILAAARIAGVDEVYAMGGAQAVAALALGTETIDRVDIVAGPGNAWVTEAKRQLYGEVGIDGLAGPSELVVVADGDAEMKEIALDLLAQAEHGAESPVVVVSDSRELLDGLERAVPEMADGRGSVADAPLWLVAAPSIDSAHELSDAFAPEHLELRHAGAESIARDRVAGCVFVGEGGATAFGDYAAGSNHVLPTGGAARFGGPLGVHAFLRRTSVVEVPAEAADALAPAVDAIAKAEGLPVHGESAVARSGR